jgi:MFS family permease
MRRLILRGRFGVLAERDFRLLFVGQVLSALGDGAAAIAVTFAVLGMGKSAGALGLVLAARYVPMAGFLLIGGVVADRLPRRRLLLSSDLVRALSQGALALLLFSGHAQLWQIVVLQVIYGTAEAFFSPGRTGLVPQLVKPEHLQPANALLSMTFDLSLIIGPAIGGVLVAAMGSGGAVAADAASFALSALLIAQIRPGRDTVAERRPLHLIADMKEGWAEVRSRKWLTRSIGNFTVFSALAVPGIVVLGPQIAKSELGGVGAWSLFMGAFGAGALVGSVASLRLRFVRPAAAVAVLMLLAAGRPAALASGLGLPVIVAFSFVAGAALSIAGILWMATLQQHVPATSLSRVDSIDDFGTFLFKPLGFVMAGPLAAAIGLHAAMALLTALPVLACVAMLASGDVRRLNWAKVANPTVALA